MVTKGLEQVAAYLDNVIVFDSDPSTYIKIIHAFMCKHDLKLSPSKGHLGATYAIFLVYRISPVDLRPNEDKVSALALMVMPGDPKQLRIRLGGLWYYRTFLRDVSQRIHPIISLLKRRQIIVLAGHGGHCARVACRTLRSPRLGLI